jgi:hypothetical protein
MTDHAYSALRAMRAYDFGSIIRRESLPLRCIRHLPFSNGSYNVRAVQMRQAVPMVGKGASEAENKLVTDLESTLK